MIKQYEQTSRYNHKIHITTRSNNIELITFGCVHLGALETDLELLQIYVDYIKAKPNRYMISIGDLIENAIPIHIPEAMWEQYLTPRQQVDEIVKILLPIKDRILGLIRGNHEKRTAKRSTFDPTEIIADKLGVPYMGWAAYIFLVVNGIEYKTFFTHGMKGGLPETALRAAFYGGRVTDTDFFAFAHKHSFAMREFTKKVLVNGTSFIERTTGIRTASFIRDPEYAAEKLYDMQYLGASIITIGSNFKHWVADNSGEFKFRDIIELD